MIASSVMKHLLRQLKLNANVQISSSELVQVVTKGVDLYNQICPTKTHLAVDELGPQFFEEIHMVDGGMFQGILTNRNMFHEMFQHARSTTDPSKFVGIVITKPPETVAVILPPISANRWFFYDSHSRPQFQYDGSYLAECSTEQEVIHWLQRVFIPFPVDINDPMNMMYNLCEGTFFQL